MKIKALSVFASLMVAMLINGPVIASEKVRVSGGETVKLEAGQEHTLEAGQEHTFP